MNEEQGYKIINLLEQILKILSDKSSYDLGDIYTAITEVESAVKRINR